MSIVGLGGRGARRRTLPWRACASATLGIAGCTLLDDSFEPTLVTGAADAASPTAPTNDDGASPVDVSTACTVETAGADGACGLVPLLPPGDEPGGAGSDASADGSAPACADGLGEFGAPEMLTGLDLEGSLYGPALSSDGRTLFFSLEANDTEKLYQATRAEPAGVSFSPPTPLAELSSSGRDATPFLSRDGLSLYFDSDRDGGRGGRDLWVAHRAEPLAPFGASTALVELNTPEHELLPWLTGDALTLLFVSSRAGSDDIWMAQRAGPLDTFGSPQPVAALNDPADEGRAVLSADGTTVFFASRRSGDADLWTATRPSPDGDLAPPTNLTALNSPLTDWDVMLSADERELLFASDRSGPLRLWHALRACK